LAGLIPELWEALPKSVREKLLSFVGKGSVDDIFKVFKYECKVDVLREALNERIENFTEEELGTAVELGIQTDAVIDRAVNFYTEVKDFVSANNVAKKLIIPLLPKMELEHVETIIKSPTEKGADLLGSHGFNEFIAGVLENKLVTLTKLKALLKKHGLERYSPD
jgi:hypothetical protein